MIPDVRMNQRPNAKDLHNFVVNFIGKRSSNKQAPTVAVGIINNQIEVYVAIQGGVFHDYGPLKSRWREQFGEIVSKWYILDSRYLVVTRRNKSEWTGYHAEMLVLSAMISANVWGRLDVYSLMAAIADVGGASICANASCCEHCGNLLDMLGIKYHEGVPEPGLTAWWNPITDVVYAHGSTEFGRSIPGIG